MYVFVFVALCFVFVCVLFATEKFTACLTSFNTLLLHERPFLRNVSDGTQSISEATEWQARARQEDKGVYRGGGQEGEYEEGRILVNTQ